MTYYFVYVYIQTLFFFCLNLICYVEKFQFVLFPSLLFLLFGIWSPGCGFDVGRSRLLINGVQVNKFQAVSDKQQPMKDGEEVLIQVCP